jgi:hypothetical protein
MRHSRWTMALLQVEAPQQHKEHATVRAWLMFQVSFWNGQVREQEQEQENVQEREQGKISLNVVS